MRRLEPESADHDLVFQPILRPGMWSFPVAGVLLAVVLWAGYAWGYQLMHGLGVTGLNRPVFWGIYVTNFIFFIGISHAGTLISAILRVTHAGWRRPITRAAEAITVFALMIGPMNIIIDLGRADRLLYPFIFGRFQSPLLWDVMAITTYFTGSVIYLYLPLIPDIAMVRDRLSRHDFRRPLYQLLSLGWTGSEEQRRRLSRAIGIMAVAIIPIAVSVHTVVSWVLAMTIQPMWHSAIFGPYFVVGAIFSGIATLIIAMAILRRAFHLEPVLTPRHFNNLGILLLVMTLAWLYFTFAEYLTTFYGGEPSEMAVFRAKVWGDYLWLFWGMVFITFVIPFFILALPKTRTIAGTVVASILINIGMWIERFTIVVPTLIHPRLPYDPGQYSPTWVEWSITAGEFAALALLYVIFSKLFPIVSPWEISEGEAEEALKASKSQRVVVEALARQR
ncbi:MAG: polysulfide reductase NrfD [Bacteroidetes bacterium]|nr:polysulfide reductase NrfD [Bacteroidota bacterium]MCL5025515.1 polysulfide reductase NrfD [Chloroflexota bacterium]